MTTKKEVKKNKKCEWCECDFYKRKKESNPRFLKRRFCSVGCRLEWQRDWYTNDNPIKYVDNSGENNPMYGVRGNKSHNWNGGVHKRKDGYVRRTINSKRILEHRYVMQKQIGRNLNDYEIVHHINGDNSDNRIENLQIMTQSEHAKLHFKNGRFESIGEI